MEHLRVKLPWGLRHQTIISDCTVQSVCLQKPSSNPTDVWPPWVPQSFLINPFPGYGQVPSLGWLFQAVRMSLVQGQCSPPAGVQHFGPKQWHWNSTHDSSPHSAHRGFVLQAQNEIETMIPANKPSSDLKLTKIPCSSGILFLAILTRGLLWEATRNLWLSEMWSRFTSNC